MDTATRSARSTAPIPKCIVASVAKRCTFRPKASRRARERCRFDLECGSLLPLCVAASLLAAAEASFGDGKAVASYRTPKIPWAYEHRSVRTDLRLEYRGNERSVPDRIRRSHRRNSTRRIAIALGERSFHGR